MGLTREMKSLKEIAQCILGMALADYSGLERQFENDTAIAVDWIEKFIDNKNSDKDLLQKHKDKKSKKMLEVINEIQHECINSRDEDARRIEKIKALCGIIQPLTEADRERQRSFQERDKNNEQQLQPDRRVK